MAVTAPRRREKGRCHEMVPRGGRISNEAAPTTMHSPYRLVSSGKRDGEPEIHGPRAGGITTPRAGGITTPRACASRHLARAHHNTSRARASRQDSEHHNTSRAAVRAHHNRTPGIEGPRGCAFYVHPNSPSSPSYACDDTGLFMFRCSQSRGHESVQIMRSCADLLPDLRKSCLVGKGRRGRCSLASVLSDRVVSRRSPVQAPHLIAAAIEIKDIPVACSSPYLDAQQLKDN